MAPEIKIGCAGWYYKDWKGSFYPEKLDPSQYLNYYSEIFDFTEINSTFYNLPSERNILGWLNNTSDSFRYAIKVWKKITHERDNSNLENNIMLFFNQLQLLEAKISIFLFQFPPWFKNNEYNQTKLENIFNQLPNQFHYALELRHKSWFDNRIINRLFNGKNLVLVTSYIQNLQPFYKKDQQFYYIRLIGDRKLSKFSHVQRKMTKSLNNLKAEVDKLRESEILKQIFIIVNNHFSGFAPETVNELKKKLSISLNSFSHQKSLSDFM